MVRYRDNRQAFEDDDMTVKVTSDSFTVEGDGHYCVFSDGSSVLPIQGQSVTFQVVTDAIPYFVFEERKEDYATNMSDAYTN